MKKAIILISMVFASSVQSAEVLDVSFLDSHNVPYNTVSLQVDLAKTYGQTYPQMKVLLIETPSLSYESYVEQNRHLDALGHDMEQLQMMIVVACTTAEYLHSYHTTIDVAKTLAQGNALFRLTLLSGSDEVLRRSGAPINVQELRKWIERPQ